MIAYVTSVGEKTTEICVKQLQRRGFEVVLMDDKEPWIQKYARFIVQANRKGEDCVRVDADVIVNRFFTPANIENDAKDFSKYLMLQYGIYDLYSNGVKYGQPVFYSHKALPIIERNLAMINPRRPEATAWRLSEINPFTRTMDDDVVGMHGFFQDADTMAKAKENRIARKQEDLIDENLLEQILKL
jgi:hypothetical protein